MTPVETDTLAYQKNERVLLPVAALPAWLPNPPPNPPPPPPPPPKGLPPAPQSVHAQKTFILWIDEILHHLRMPGMMIPCKYQQTMVSLGFEAVQDFVHPQ